MFYLEGKLIENVFAILAFIKISAYTGLNDVC